MWFTSRSSFGAGVTASVTEQLARTLLSAGIVVLTAAAGLAAQAIDESSADTCGFFSA